MISLPKIPEGATLLTPHDVESEFMAEMARLKKEKATPEEFEDALRSLVLARTTIDCIEVAGFLAKEISHGSPHVLKPSLVKFLVQYEGREPHIFPPGYDDSMTLPIPGGTGNGDC